MTNEQMTLTAPWIGILYLCGTWAVAYGISLKVKAKSYFLASLLLVLCGICLLGYLSYIDQKFWLRMLTINFVITCLLAIVVPGVYSYFKQVSLLEKIFCVSYFFLTIYNALRFLVILFYLKDIDAINLSFSNWWMLMLAINIILSIWFAIIIAATTVKEQFTLLNNERYQDPLTKLYNRRGFFEKTGALIKKYQITHLYIVMCDIDHFKKINDTWGHAIGDKILCEIGQILKDSVREEDLIARFGGEEFVIMVKCSNYASTIKLVNRIRDRIEKQLFTENCIDVTVSFGIAEIQSHTQLMEALELADQRLYAAKNNGRNQVCFH
ncbi:GGDEF domain-containing protein [Acinetobacter sp. ANC 5383]